MSRSALLHANLCSFFDGSLNTDQRIRCGQDLCDGLEISVPDKDLHELTLNIYENVQSYLNSTEPQNIQEAPVQQLRRLCLELIQKLPNGDHLRPYARRILGLLFKLVEVENEENVLLCVKLIIDLHKYYRPSFSVEVTHFLSFVRRVYRGLQNGIRHIFELRPVYEVQSLESLDLTTAVQQTFTITEVYTHESRDDGTFAVYHLLPKSCFSLKVMQEIPILVVLMYQLFKQHIHQDVSEFIPLIMDFINLKPSDAQKKSAHFNQDVFIDFMAAQVKTLSFLAYVIKIYQDLVEHHSASLVQGMMNLLYNCPPSVTNMRKEFFIAARHILSAPEIRPKFLDVLDELMNEDILIGQGYTVRDALRPLAYSTLADLTHHIRGELSLAKIARAIDLYGRNMHDDTLPFSIQQMSLRLLLNLVECVRLRAVSVTTAAAGPTSTLLDPSKQNGVTSGTARHLLLQTLRLCVLKSRVVAEHYLPALEALCTPEVSSDDQPSPSGVTKQRSASALDPNTSSNNEPKDISSTLSSMTSGGTFKQQALPTPDSLPKGQLSHLDLRALIKALMTGMRNIVMSMIQCPRVPSSPSDSSHTARSSHTPTAPPASTSATVTARFLSPEELVVLSEYFNFGMRMIDIVQVVVKDGKLYTRSHPNAKSPDERILIETFALTFAQLSPVSFQEIFSSKIHDFVRWCQQSPSYTNMALHLLSQPNKTSCFGHILLSYLVDRLERLGDGTDESLLYMRLFKLCFSSVNMADTENEHVMKLYLRRIVQGSMQCCLTAKEPTAYLTLLRTLFRSIGGGAHDKLYREFFPLLPSMLSTLNRLLRSPHRAHARSLLGELCVIVPVRLSTLLPYLSLLMEPLIYVLNCDTVNQGLRTLELCVDNMQPDFLHDHLYQVRGDMLLALYNSLHSSNEYVQKMSFKVLGKLGRFNRTNLPEVRRLRVDPTKGETGPQISLCLTEFRQQPIDLPVRCLVDAAIEALQNPIVDQPTKTRAWELLQSLCVAALDLPRQSSDGTVTVDGFYDNFQQPSFLDAVKRFVELNQTVDDSVAQADRILKQHTCCSSVDLEHSVMVRVLAGLLLAGLNKPLRDTHTAFISFLVRHLVLCSVANHVTQERDNVDPIHTDSPCQSSSPNRSISVSLSPYVPMERLAAHFTTESTDGGVVVDDTATDLPKSDESTRNRKPSSSEHTPTLPQCVNETTQPPPSSISGSGKLTLDPVVLIDALLFAMGHEEKKLLQPTSLLLELMHGTVMVLLKAAQRRTSEEEEQDAWNEETATARANAAVVHLPLYRHLAHAIVDMLHHPAWYVKWGACATLICLLRLLPSHWFRMHLLPLLRGLLHCVHDLSNQMSQGALDMARDCARLLLRYVLTGTDWDWRREEIASSPSSSSQDPPPVEDESTRVDVDMDAEDTDVGTGKTLATKRGPTTGRVRSRQGVGTTSTSRPRRPCQASLRRGRSASSSISGSQTEPMETDDMGMDVNTNNEQLPSSMHSQAMASANQLLDTIAIELLDTLLSETAQVRQEARTLFRLLSHYTGRPLSVLLAPHWQARLGHLLPPQPPLRLPDLPVSTQLVILEINHFFAQSDVSGTKPRTSQTATSDSNPTHNLTSGAGLLRYDPTKRADRCFLIDVRSLLTPADGASTNSAGASTATTAGASATGDVPPLAARSTGPSLSSKHTTSSTTRPSAAPHRLKSVELRVAACRVLSLTWYLTNQKTQNLSALFRCICCDQDAVHEAAFACLKEFVTHTTIDIELRHANVKSILQNVRQTTSLRLSTARQLSYCAQLFPSTFNERLCDAIYSHLNTLVDNLAAKQNTSSISTLTPPTLELCAVLIDLFHLIPLATAKHVSHLIELVIRAERALNIDLTSPLRLPLVRFLARYPAETCVHLLTGSRWPYDTHAQRILLYVIRCPQGQAVTDYLKTNHHILSELIRPNELSDQKSTTSLSNRHGLLPRAGTPLTAACPRHLALRIVHAIHKLFPNWLLQTPTIASDSSSPRGKSRCKSTAKSHPTAYSSASVHPITEALIAYWRSDAFARRQSSLTLVTLAPSMSMEHGSSASSTHATTDPDVASLEAIGRTFVELEEREGAIGRLPNTTHATTAAAAAAAANTLTLTDPGALIASGTANLEHWDEPRLLLDFLLDCIKADPDNYDLLCLVCIGVARLRSVAGLLPLRTYLDSFLATASTQWHRHLFLHFVSIVQRRISESNGTGGCSTPGATGGGLGSNVDDNLGGRGGGGGGGGGSHIQDGPTTVDDLHRLLAHLILPGLTRVLQACQSDPVRLAELMGGPPRTVAEETDTELVHLFISVLLEDPAVQNCTELRVIYYLMASLFVHHAPDYIHPRSELDQPDPRLTRLIQFAWPCITSSLSVVDLQEKYTGLLLLTHLVANSQPQLLDRTTMAIPIFQCLAKGTHTETKKIVNPALDILIPAWVQGPDDQRLLASTTRKIMLEDHGIQSCIHILGIIVRHADLYYPIRHQLLPHIIVILSRLSAQQLPVEQRRLALDMIDTAARWDHRCRQGTAQANKLDRSITSDTSDLGVAESSSGPDSLAQLSVAPMEKTQCDQLLNLMIRFACQAVDASQSGGNLAEASVTRALARLQFALQRSVWGTETCELRLGFIDRFFIATDASTAATAASNTAGSSATSGPGSTAAATSTATASGGGSSSGGAVQHHVTAGSLGATQTTNLLMSLEVLRVLFTGLDSPTLLLNVKHFSAGLCSLLSHQMMNVRLIRSCSNLIRAMLERFPADASHRQKITTHAELFDIYSATLKTIQEAFTLYSDNGPKPTLLARLQSAFLLFTATQVQTNTYAFVDRCIVQLVKLTHRLIQDVISPCYGPGSQDSGASAQLTDLVITGLEVIKSRLNVVSHEMRKNSFGPDLFLIMDRARDARLLRVVIKILRDWINVPKSEEHFAPTPREKVHFFHKLWEAYPHWVNLAPEVAREILECVYEVYTSASLFKNHDLYLKLEQAFCCSLLAPFPDIRERFTALYLEASQLQLPSAKRSDGTQFDSAVGGSDRDELNTSITSVSPRSLSISESGDPNSLATGQTASLLVRLLFLFVSSNWDESHFRDGFWLPLFFDILLCDVDASLPPALSTQSARFLLYPPASELTSCTTTALNKSGTSHAGEQAMDLTEADLFHTSSTACTTLSNLLELQSHGLREVNGMTCHKSLRGLLCLVHRSPALASQLFSQLWPQLWNRLLLRRPVTEPSNPVTTTTTGIDSACVAAPDARTPCATPIDDSATLLMDGTEGGGVDCDSAKGSSLSTEDIRAFVIPQLLRFLTSDQHVNPSEPQPSALGAFLASLATTPDTVLVYLPLPAISYIGSAYNQWHTVALFTESVCARAREAGASRSDFVYNLALPSTTETTALRRPHESDWRAADLPLGSASLSLVALYDAMNEVDHLTTAWWYRLDGVPPTSSMLRLLTTAQHGHLIRALESALDQLAIPPQQAIGSTNFTPDGTSASGRTASASVRSSATPTVTALTTATACAQFGEHVNRARLHEYCLRYLRQLGQWDSLDQLAANVQPGSSGFLSMSTLTASGGTTGSGGTGGSTTTSATGGSAVSGASALTAAGGGGSVYWGLKADAAWRRSDWPEVYSSLARLANECPRNELSRYALIQGAACVAGRRNAGFNNTDLDPYGGSSGDLQTSASGGNVGTGVGATSSSGGPVGSMNAGSNNSSPSASSSSTMNYMVSLLKTSELESHRVMATVLREWRRLPLIVTNQHVPLLQIAHRAVEITEGNSLLAQYCGHVLTGSTTSNTGASSGSTGSSTSASAAAAITAAATAYNASSAASNSGASTPTASSSTGAGSGQQVPHLRMPLTQALHDYKTMFKSWQSRPPSIGDDLGFWHDLFSWRQVVEETIITCHPHVQKFGPERMHLVAVCERELALSQLQLARGARKNRCPSIAQQHLDRYVRMNLPPLFEKTKQEIKLKMVDLRKDELLEGLELMEKTNIQQFEKKDRAKFFCYKAVFFSHFNKGDEATKNFGYATQMQDNIHKVWSIYGDFLENVYSGYPSAKREIAVSTTGIFAMQALMEAASVSGGLERRSRADVAKCIWLLTLDDAKGQQRLARTFEERSSRVRPAAFLPWLPNLVVSLLRPEGRFIVSALRGVLNAQPTVLYNLLRPLQHQLCAELRYDEQLASLARSHNANENQGSLALEVHKRIQRLLIDASSEETDPRQTNRTGGGMDAAGTNMTSANSSIVGGRRTAVVAGKVGSNLTSASATISPLTLTQSSLTAARKKKKVIVVMRGVESERSGILPGQTTSGLITDPTDGTTRPSGGPTKKVVIRGMGCDDGEEEEDGDAGEDLEEVEETEEADAEQSTTAVSSSDGSRETETVGGSGDGEKTGSGDGGSQSSRGGATEDPPTLGVTEAVGTGCLSSTVGESLHRVNLLLNQLRRQHSARLYALDVFTNEVGGRLQPTWSEQLLAQLSSLLDQLHQLAWTTLTPDSTNFNVNRLKQLCAPDWLIGELQSIVGACGLPMDSPWITTNEQRTVCKNPTSDSKSTRERVNSSSSSSESAHSSSETAAVTTTTTDAKRRSKNRRRSNSSSHKRSTVKSSTDSPTTGVKSSVLAKSTVPSVITPTTASGRSNSMSAAQRRALGSSQTSVTNPGSFVDVERLMMEKLHAEASVDPWFAHIRRQLQHETADLKGETVLTVIQLLTRSCIPLVEQRVNRLPRRTHLSDYGARRLIELPNLVVVSPPSIPSTTAQQSASSTSPLAASILNLSGPSSLELPGEVGLLKCATPGSFFGASQGTTSSTSSAASTNAAMPGINQPLALQLVVAEILPQVVRVSQSPGRFSPAARRLAIRASNGRVFFYDLTALGTVLCDSGSTTALQLAAVAGARTHALTAAQDNASGLNLASLGGMDMSSYGTWRHDGPLQLFQLLNDMLAGQPETAKRQLSLFVPRTMEVGPMGLCLTEVGSSAPAASVNNASALPFPSASPLGPDDLTCLARPPAPLGGSSSVVTGLLSSEKDRPAAWTLTFDRSDILGPCEDPAAPWKPCLPSPPPGPLGGSLVSQAAASAIPSATAVGGSAAVAAEAMGRPTGSDTGCPPLSISLSVILNEAHASWGSHSTPTASPPSSSVGDPEKRLETRKPPTAAHELICTFYENLIDAGRKSGGSGSLDRNELKELYHEMMTKIPSQSQIRSPQVSTLGILPEDCVISEGRTEKNATLLRRWAANRMLDAESYWHFRHSIAQHLGLIALVEHLFHLTPLHPASLVLDPRSGHAEARHVRFSIAPSSLESSMGGGARADSSSQLASCFGQAFGLRPSTVADSCGVEPPSPIFRISPPVVPFRLTPHLAGFVCAPGCPATRSPFAASFTTAAQAMSVAQRSHSFPSLYRTLLRADFILWHRCQQATQHAYQLWPLHLTPSAIIGIVPSEDNQTDVDDATDTEAGELESSVVTAPLVPELTNDSLIRLITLTLDATNSNLKATADHSGPKPHAWTLINAATNPDNLSRMSPHLLPWL